MAGVNQSGIYHNKIIGALRPKIMCVQYRPDIVFGPSGWNLILPSGHDDVEQLAGSCPAISIEPSGFLNYGSGITPITEPHWVSRTIAFLYMPKADYDDSRINNHITIFNMKLWLESDAAFSGISPRPYIQILPSGKWKRNLFLGSGWYGAYEIPRSIPSGQNIYRWDGCPWLSGIGLNQHTQIIYSSIIFPSGEHAVGQYGGLGVGTFRFRFTYDWTDEFARINLPGDL